MLGTISSSAPATWQDYAATFGQMIAALAVMALAAWAVTLLGKKRLSPRRKTRIDVVEKLALENGRGLWLVEIEGRRLLIGSSSGSVRLLCDVSAPKGDPEKEPPRVAEAEPGPLKVP